MKSILENSVIFILKLYKKNNKYRKNFYKNIQKFFFYKDIYLLKHLIIHIIKKKLS